MLKSLKFREFKSFQEAELPLEQLTILIGSNGSGKSNALDGLRVLSQSAHGIDLMFVLDGMRGNLESGIRGGSKSCPRFGAQEFTVGATIERSGENAYLEYELTVRVDDRITVSAENLKEVTMGRSGRPRERVVFQASSGDKSSGDIEVEYDNRKKGRNPKFECVRFQSVLTQVGTRLPRSSVYGHIHEAVATVVGALRQVMFLDPIPHEMRDYVPQTSVELVPSAANLSAVVGRLIEQPEYKELLLEYLRQIPDVEITDVGVVKTELHDVMLQVQEQAGGVCHWVDARGLSDGTLRSLAVMAALLSEPPGSLVVIEEIDNGWHPSKARAILSLLTDMSKQRNIQLLLTTHNPALLNALPAEYAKGVVVCYRDRDEGDSRFASLIELTEYLRIATHERIGDAMETGAIDRSARGEPIVTVNEAAMEWLRTL